MKTKLDWFTKLFRICSIKNAKNIEIYPAVKSTNIIEGLLCHKVVVLVWEINKYPAVDSCKAYMEQITMNVVRDMNITPLSASTIFRIFPKLFKKREILTFVIS